MKPQKIILACLVITFFSGCDSKSQRAASREDWDHALNEIVVFEQISDEGKGIRLLRACLSNNQKTEVECGTPAYAVRDDFTKTTTYLTRATQFSEIAEESYLGAEIELKDCGTPVYLLSPRLIDKTRGNLIDGVAVLQGDELIFEKEFVPEENKRRKMLDENFYNNWHSTTRVVASDRDIEKLKKIKIGEPHKIRLSGAHGFQMVDDELLEEFPKDVVEGLAIYEKISNALKNKVPIECK